MKLRSAWTGLLLAATTTVAASSTVLETPGDFGDCKLLLRKAAPAIVFATLDARLVWKPLLARETFREYKPSISANWLALADASGDDGVLALVASFKDKRARMYRLVDGQAPSLVSVLAEADDKLRIDPTLLRIGDTYLATLTEITGRANNKDPNATNGFYEIKLYASTDAVHWEFVSSIVRVRRNLEDGSLLYDSKTRRLYFIFEAETIDMGPSRILICQSDDQGKNWSKPAVLIADGSDNEPATCRLDGEILTVTFSSDRNFPGGSYEKSEMFIAEVALADLELKSVMKVEAAGVGIALLSALKTEFTGMAVLGLRNCMTNNRLIELETAH